MLKGWVRRESQGRLMRDVGGEAGRRAIQEPEKRTLQRGKCQQCQRATAKSWGLQADQRQDILL